MKVINIMGMAESERYLEILESNISAAYCQSVLILLNWNMQGTEIWMLSSDVLMSMNKLRILSNLNMILASMDHWTYRLCL